MAEEKSYIYGKFFKDRANITPRFRISTFEDALAWDGEQEPHTDRARSNEIVSLYKLNEQIFSRFVAFYDLVPLLNMITESFPRAIIDDEIIREFKTGETIEDNDEYFMGKSDLGKYPKIIRSIRKVTSFYEISPLFPRLYIIGIIAEYDNLIYNLVRLVINKNPKILFNGEKSVTFEEIEKFENMDDLKVHLIDQEAEKVLRKSHEDQLKWFSEKLSIRIEPDKRLFSKFIEICERRNLFAHTGGTVSAHYLEKCEKAGYKCENTKIGDKLFVKQKYFKDSIETIIEFSAQLLHVIWSKVENEKPEEPAKSLINITYNLIHEKKYTIAIRIIEFILNNEKTKMDDGTRKTHIINLCNAMRLNKQEDYLKVLDTEDWSVLTLPFQLALPALRLETDEFILLLAKVKNSDEITKDEIIEWPVFSAMRKDDNVRKAFKEHFGSDMETNRELQSR